MTIEIPDKLLVPLHLLRRKNPFCPSQCLSKRSKEPLVNVTVTVRWSFGMSSVAVKCEHHRLVPLQSQLGAKPITWWHQNYVAAVAVWTSFYAHFGIMPNEPWKQNRKEKNNRIRTWKKFEIYPPEVDDESNLCHDSTCWVVFPLLGDHDTRWSHEKKTSC